MTLHTWRQLRRILLVLAVAAWAVRVVQMISHLPRLVIYTGRWTIAYLVLFGLFLVVDTGIRVLDWRRDRAQRALL